MVSVKIGSANDLFRLLVQLRERNSQTEWLAIVESALGSNRYPQSWRDDVRRRIGNIV